MVEDARSFAEKAHEGQFRKGPKRPYIVHPLEVAKIVSTMTDGEEMISAALLHATLEDCRQVTKEQIKEAFGERVLELVWQECEDKANRPLCYYFDREPVCAHRRRNGYGRGSPKRCRKSTGGTVSKGNEAPVYCTSAGGGEDCVNDGG